MITSIYGIWNLDFFRSVYTPFCLNPSLTTLQVMSLDYIIAAYPLVLIVVMYLLVDLYSHNCRPVVVTLKPFHYCSRYFRHQLNIRMSLVDAFGTFFILSYVKFLSTTMDLLAPTQVWDYYGSSYRVYHDGTMKMFKGRHIPYAVLYRCVCWANLQYSASCFDSNLLISQNTCNPQLSSLVCSNHALPLHG